MIDRQRLTLGSGVETGHVDIIIIIIISIRTKSTNTEKQLTQQYRL